MQRPPQYSEQGDWHLETWTDAGENITANVGITTPPIREIVRARWKVPLPWLVQLQATPSGFVVGDALTMLFRVSLGSGRVMETLSISAPVPIVVPNVPNPIPIVNPTNAIGGWFGAERIIIEWSYVVSAIDPGPRKVRLWASCIPFGIATPGGGAL